MQDIYALIDFVFSVMGQLWVLITSYWFLSMPVVLFIFTSVILLIRGTKEDA